MTERTNVVPTDRDRRVNRVNFAGRAALAVVAVLGAGTAVACGDGGRGRSPAGTQEPTANASIVPVETVTPAISTDLALQIKQICTPGIDLPRIPENELANLKVTRENAVQFLSTDELNFQLKLRLPIPDPNLGKVEGLIVCDLHLTEATRKVGFDLDAVDSKGYHQTVTTYEELISLETHGGTDKISKKVAKALPFLDQGAFPPQLVVEEEVDGDKPVDTETVVYVRLKLVGGNECKEEIWAVQVGTDPNGYHKLGDVFNPSIATNGECKPQ